jgi:hypothetical protein
VGSCDVIHRIFVPDDLGSHTLVETTTSGVACLYYPIDTPAELLTQGAVVGEQLYCVCVSQTTQVTSADWLRIKGKLHEILGILEASTSVLQRLVCRLHE